MLKDIGIDDFTIAHLNKWLRDKRCDDEREGSFNAIFLALQNDPSLINDHGWGEIERMGKLK